jgi:hypothetical protein
MASSCARNVPKPDADVCVVNVPALHQKCYNIARDYDDNGYIKKDAKPMFKQYKDEAEMLAGLNKNIATTPDGWAAIKAYLKSLREEQEKANQPQPSTDYGG